MNNEQAQYTYAQQVVIDQLIQGKSNDEIAEALGVSIKTVKAHLTAIYKISGCTKDRQFLAGYYTQWKFPLKIN